MSVGAAPPPTPGTINVGELLVDAQYKTLWLGVDPSIDPIQSILICDMAALIAGDAQTLVDAKAYTDQQIQTRAPVVHSHTHNDISDWEDAVIDTVEASVVNFKKGMIITYYGLLTDIQAFTGWALCDGTNGTPDLRDKFIVGAGNKAIKDNYTPTGGQEVLVTEAGSHNHYAAQDANWQVPNAVGYTLYHLLAANQLPPHTHPYHEILQGTGGNPDGHTHYLIDFGSVYTLRWTSGTSQIDVWRKTNGDVVARPSPVQISIDVNTTSADWSHRHQIAWQAGHKHRVPIDFYQKGLPWYALAYIMKL